jgi:ribosomal protein L32
MFFLSTVDEDKVNSKNKKEKFRASVSLSSFNEKKPVYTVQETSGVAKVPHSVNKL